MTVFSGPTGPKILLTQNQVMMPYPTFHFPFSTFHLPPASPAYAINYTQNQFFYCILPKSRV